MIKIHQNEQSPFAHLKSRDLSVSLQLHPCRYGTGLAGMTMSMPFLTQYEDHFEHANQVVLIMCSLSLVRRDAM